MNRADFFKLHRDGDRPNTRGHEWRILLQRPRTEMRKSFFDIRIINQWNNLPENIVCKQTINSFKQKIDRHLYYTRGGGFTSE